MTLRSTAPLRQDQGSPHGRGLLVEPGGEGFHGRDAAGTSLFQRRVEGRKRLGGRSVAARAAAADQGSQTAAQSQSTGDLLVLSDPGQAGRLGLIQLFRLLDQ